MSVFDADDFLFMVMPVGFEERTTVVVAKNLPEAERRAMTIGNVSEAVSLHGVDFKTINITEQFKKLGWEIYVAREGIYH